MFESCDGMEDSTVRVRLAYLFVVYPNKEIYNSGTFLAVVQDFWEPNNDRIAGIENPELV